MPLDGMVHAAEVYNSAGTLVASPDFTAQPPGTTSFADSTGKTWTLAGGAEITNRRFRLHGEVPSWSPRWDVSGNDIETPVEVAGIMRRLTQGDKALNSTLRREVPTSAGILAYWPMEESAGAIQAYSPMAGVKPMNVTGLEFAAVDTLPSSSALPTLKAPSSILASAPAPPAGSTGWNVSWLYRLDQAPASERTYMGITSSGTVRRWAIAFAASVSRITGYDEDSNEVVNQAIATGSDLFNQWVQVDFRARQVGSDVEWRIIWRDVGGDAGSVSTTYTGTVGRCTGVTSPSAGYHADLDGMALGHIGIFGIYEPSAYAGAVTGYAPETALSRMARLTAEESDVPLSWTDGDDQQDSEWMGPQRPGKLMDLLQEAADADGGVLYENRDALALIYRDRGTFYNQTPGLVLNYAADGEVAPPLEPTDDDKDVRNDRTVTRLGGSSARAVIEEGPLSVHAPPLGVGVYDDAVTLNVFADEQTEQIAAWRAHLGTWDEARYPSVHVNLAAAPHLIDQVLNLDIGDVIRINNLPEWMPPGPVDLIVQGYVETIDQYAWDIVYNCTPAGPWTVAVVDGPTLKEDFESSTPLLPLTAGGTLPWARSTAQAHTGTWSLKSGAITNNQTSDAILTLPAGARVLSLWYFTSSEAAGSGFDGDRLTVLVDGVVMLTAQGTTLWTQLTLDVTGASTVTFRYTKDNSTAVGSDAVWIDDIEITVASAATPRADTDGSVLSTAETDTATVLAVHTDTATGPHWADSATYPGEFPFDVDMGGEVATVTNVTTAADLFTRTVSNGWGTSSSGLVWNEAGSLASDRSVNGSRGVITLASSISTLRFQELLPEAIGDCEVRVRLSVSAVATGASLVPGVLLRCFNTSNYYRARIHFGTGGGMFVSVTRDATQIGASPTLPYTYAAGDEFELRVRLVGHTIQMRVWPVGAAEPTVWHHTETVITNPIPVGTIGVTGSAFAGMTNVSPQLRYDQFEIVTPQRFTVARSVNGIVKPHTAGTPLSLARKSIVRL